MPISSSIIEENFNITIIKNDNLRLLKDNIYYSIQNNLRQDNNRKNLSHNLDPIAKEILNQYFCYNFKSKKFYSIDPLIFFEFRSEIADHSIKMLKIKSDYYNQGIPIFTYNDNQYIAKLQSQECNGYYEILKKFDIDTEFIESVRDNIFNKKNYLRLLIKQSIILEKNEYDPISKAIYSECVNYNCSIRNLNINAIIFNNLKNQIAGFGSRMMALKSFCVSQYNMEVFNYNNHQDNSYIRSQECKGYKEILERFYVDKEYAKNICDLIFSKDNYPIMLEQQQSFLKDISTIKNTHNITPVNEVIENEKQENYSKRRARSLMERKSKYLQETKEKNKNNETKSASYSYNNIALSDIPNENNQQLKVHEENSSLKIRRSIGFINKYVETRSEECSSINNLLNNRNKNMTDPVKYRVNTTTSISSVSNEKKILPIEANQGESSSRFRLRNICQPVQNRRMTDSEAYRYKKREIIPRSSVEYSYNVNITEKKATCKKHIYKSGIILNIPSKINQVNKSPNNGKSI